MEWLHRIAAVALRLCSWDGSIDTATRYLLNNMNINIQLLAERHFLGLHAVIDAVARERRFLSFTAAPSLAESILFYEKLLQEDHVSFVAISESAVVGWCDIQPSHGQSCAHVGTLGTGLREDFRHQGIGAMLMKTALDDAYAKGFRRIQLGVRVDNRNARSLYKRIGFIEEGVNRNMYLVDETYHDSIAMALLFNDQATQQAE